MSGLLLLRSAGGSVATVAAAPTVSLQIAPGSLANDQNPSWTEIGSLLLNFTYTRGRQSELEQAEAGTASFALNNASRILDPAYTLGPFYGELLPNIQVQYLATIGGTTYPLFRGHVERFTATYDGPNAATMTLECVDRFAALSRATISGSWGEQLSGARILALLAAANWPTTVTPSGWTLGTNSLGVDAALGATVLVNSLDAGKATLAALTIPAATPTSVVAQIQAATASEPGRSFFNGAGYAVFQDRSRMVPTPVASALTLSDDPSSASATVVPYQDVILDYSIDEIANDVELTAADGSTIVSATDQASIDRYWRIVLGLETQLRPTDSDLYQQAGWFLFQKKAPYLRVKQIAVRAWTSTGFPALLARELGDRVTVLRTPPGGTSQLITQDAFIERLTVSGNATPVWNFSFQLSAFVPPPTPWTLGTSALDSTTALVYA